MGATITKFGDWVQAGVALQAVQTKIAPLAEAQLRQDGELILTTLRNHIMYQDLPWVPLSDTTIRLKKGNDDIYVETGFLYDNVEVRRIRSAKDNMTIFVGASPWAYHPEAKAKLSDLMIWLEYGTDQGIPERPLIRPTWDEVEPLIKNNWQSALDDLVTRAGR